VPVVHLVGALVACHRHLLGVDDDDVVAHVHVRGEGRLVLAAQAHGDDRGEAAQHDALGVDEDPLLVDVLRGRGEGFHRAGVRAKGAPAEPVRGRMAAYERFHAQGQAHLARFIHEISDI
jgi:hypothetical protein